MYVDKMIALRPRCYVLKCSKSEVNIVALLFTQRRRPETVTAAVVSSDPDYAAWLPPQGTCIFNHFS